MLRPDPGWISKGALPSPTSPLLHGLPHPEIPDPFPASIYSPPICESHPRGENALGRAPGVFCMLQEKPWQSISWGACALFLRWIGAICGVPKVPIPSPVVPIFVPSWIHTGVRS
eukprot:6491081-Amphidinium_carterae.2